MFAALQGSLVLYPAAIEPRFPVDTYGYIAKAEQMRSCPRQECPALVDLRAQVAPAADPGVNWHRNRAYHRGLYIYHPLRSALLLGLRMVLPSWEAAWLALTVAGQALLVGAIAYFAYAVWGPFAGGLALLILAPRLFAGYHGLHTVVPGTLALALGFLSWALIVGRTWAGRVLMPALVAAMLTMHAVGLVFAGMTLLLYLAVMDRRAATTWLMLVAAGGLVLIHLALPHLIDRPALAHWQHPPPADWTFWRALGESLAEAGVIVRDWSDPLGGPLAVVLLVTIGLAAAPAWRPRRRLLTGAILAATAVASAFYVLPRYPAELFSRVWIPVAVFASGAIACSWSMWVGAGGALYQRLRSRASRPAALALLRQDRGRPALGFLALGVLVFTGLGYTGAMHAGFFPSLIEVMSARHRQMPLEVAQPADVLRKLRTGDSVLYMDEFPMYFYFSHGGLEHPVVYYPAMGELADKQRWVSEKVGMVISMRTGDQYKEALGDPDVPSLSGGFPLRDDTVVRLRAGEGEIWRAAEIRFENAGSDATLRVRPGPDDDARQSWTLSVPASGQGWVSLAVPDGASSRVLEITRAAGTGPILLSGIRTGAATTFDWPWDQGVSVAYQYVRDEAEGSNDDGPVGRVGSSASASPAAPGGDGVDAAPRAEAIIEFDSQALIPARCESRGVVDDRGAMVAVRARCGDA